jgi:hypothetical protein
MNKVIPLRRSLPFDPVPICPINAIDDDALDVRLWALILSGQRGSPVYLGNEENVLAGPDDGGKGQHMRFDDRPFEGTMRRRAGSI